MRRAALLAVVGLTAAATTASAQLVPLARCHAAFPCSVPYGLRPADAVTNLPDAGIGNSLIGIELGANGFKPRLAVAPVSEDPAESAARMYVHRNPLAFKKTPTPGAAAPPPTPRPD
jgi:hypothetical protein